jgi:hypothetical protein
MGESRIGCNDLDQALIKQVDVGGKPSDAAARKALQHRTFQQSGDILGGDFVVTELAPDSKHRGELSVAEQRRHEPRNCGWRHELPQGASPFGVELARGLPANVIELDSVRKIGQRHCHSPSDFDDFYLTQRTLPKSG